jgi:hypothetical protein
VRRAGVGARDGSAFAALSCNTRVSWAAALILKMPFRTKVFGIQSDPPFTAFPRSTGCATRMGRYAALVQSCRIVGKRFCWDGFDFLG